MTHTTHILKCLEQSNRIEEVFDADALWAVVPLGEREVEDSTNTE